MATVVDNVPTNVKVEHVPPKSLVIIWVLMAAELGFDLITTIIAFVATLTNDYCCGSLIHLGPLPLSTTIPFFLLILTELSFLARAVLLTLWPSRFGSGKSVSGATSSKADEEGFEVKLSGSDGDSTRTGDNDVGSSNKVSNASSMVNGSVEVAGASPNVKSLKQPVDKPKSSTNNHKAGDRIAPTIGDIESSERRSIAAKDKQRKDNAQEPEFVAGGSDRKRGRCATMGNALCSFFKWNAKMVLTVIGMLTLLNPFFSCVIAWMLLYQSNKKEAFVVLGLAGASIILHFIGLRLEGGLRTCYSKLLHSVALLPFLVTVVLMLVYLREGGVCYNVQSQLFLFSGCEVCDDGTPPVNGQCGDLAVGSSSLGGLVNVDKIDINILAALAERGTTQGTFCSQEVSFCFYSF